MTTINQNNKPDEPVSKVPRLEDEIIDEQTTPKENEINIVSNELNDKENQLLLKSNDNLLSKEVKRTTTRRKKKLIIDDIKEIDSVTMKTQLNDTSAIMGTLELAPPTKKLMQLKESGSIDKLLMHTSRPLNCLALQKLYTNNMVTKKHVDMPVEVANKEEIKENRLQNNIIDENTSVMSVQEKQRDDNNIDNDKLPLADSLVDNDVTKHSNLMQMNDITIENNNNIIEGEANLVEPNLEEANLMETTLIKPADEPSMVFNPLENQDFNKESELEITQAPLEMTPPQQQKHKSSNTTSTTAHRKSGVTNVTTFNNDLLIDELNNENDCDSNKILNKRAKTMISLLNKSLSRHVNVGFFELTKRNARKQVAQKFYSLLILKKYDAIDVTQCDSFGDIIITKSNKFDNFVSC